MKLIARLILFTFTNTVALMVVAKLIPGFSLNSDIQIIITLAASFAVINLTLKPLLHFVLSPLIILTIGLFAIVINASLLYLLDFLSSNLRINTLTDLVIATVIIGFINLLTAWSAKKSY